MEQLKPNLFIVGAPKCGTTFLYDFLEISPACFLPEIKELNFFSATDLKNSGSYYKDYKAADQNAYLNHYKTAKEWHKYRLDASVSYFISETAAEGILAFNSEAKIIIMLRDPVKRAFSHYLMDRRMGLASGSLESYLNQPSSFHYMQYIGNSNYSKNVERYLQLFGKNRVLVLRLEDLKHLPEKLSAFLEIEITPQQDFYEKVVNPNKEAKNFLGKFVLKNRHIVERLKRHIPEKLKRGILAFIYKEAKNESMSSSEEKLLNALLVNDLAYFNSLKNV